MTTTVAESLRAFRYFGNIFAPRVMLCGFTVYAAAGRFMSRLFVVRHGQASFMEQNYDKLSATGEIQARLLGEYWAHRRVVFDRIYSGPRVRQIETARIAGEVY